MEIIKNNEGKYKKKCRIVIFLHFFCSYMIGATI